jgi:hypothetical protein
VHDFWTKISIGRRPIKCLRLLDLGQSNFLIKITTWLVASDYFRKASCKLLVCMCSLNQEHITSSALEFWLNLCFVFSVTTLPVDMLFAVFSVCLVWLR